MDAGDGLLDDLFSSLRRALAEESGQRPPYPSNRHLAAAAATSTATTDDPVRRSDCSSPKATAETIGGAGVRCAEAGGTCSTGVAGGYRHRLCKAEPDGTMHAVLAPRAGGSEARDTNEKIVHCEIKSNAEESLRSLRERRRHAGAARRVRVGHVMSRREAFCHLSECRLAQARAQGLVKARRLQLQCADSTRRLQELLHECVGEYEKARLRGLRRRKLSAEACDSVLAERILDLRWSRFCSRLEQDALGLVSAHDMGDPTTESGHGLNTGSSSSSSSSAAAAAATAAVASLLAPLLARSGLGDCRVLRIVAVCPRSGSPEGGGGSQRSSSYLERRAASNALTAASGSGRLLHSEQRRGGGRRAGGGARGGGIVEALRAELRDEGAGAPASIRVVLDSGAENSPLGVADVFRKAVLCGNDGLVAALSCSDGAAANGHRKHSNGNVGNSNNNSAVRAASVGLRRSSSGLPVVGAQGKPGDNESAVAARARRPHRTHRNSTTGSGSGSDSAEGGFGSSTGCVVVGAQPGLLLSSSHLLWALRPPFDEAAAGTTTCDSAVDGTGEGADGATSCSAEPAGRDRKEEVDTTEASGRRNHSSESRGVGNLTQRTTSVDGSRRERLDRDLAWIGAAPVGSRVYYCLEEAEWAASQRRGGYESSLPHAATSEGFEESMPCGRSRRRRRPRSAEDAPRSALGHKKAGESSPSSGDDGDDANPEEVGKCDHQGNAEIGPRRAEGQDVGTVHDRHKAAATAFARSVSRMLAKVYLGPSPESQQEQKGRDDSSGDNGLGAPAPPAAWVSRTGGEASAAVPGFASEDTASATFVVSRVTDTHRRTAQAKVDFDGNERLQALAAVPDVLVAADRPEMRGKRLGGHGGGPRAASKNPPSLHFAPAGVLQLVGTPHFREFVEALPPAARARLSKLYPESSIRTAPVGQLYIALAPAFSQATTLSASAVVASAAQARSAPRKFVVRQQQAAGQRPEQCDAHPSYPPKPAGAGCPTETAGVGPPMPGALVHPLPARAVRELLQIYVATTRTVGVVRTAVGEAGLEKETRHRTSGLLFSPPAQDRGSGGIDSQPIQSGGDDDDNNKAEDHDREESRRRGKAGGFGGAVVSGEQARSAEERGTQLEDLAGPFDGGDGGGSSDWGGREKRDRVRLAARPPSAVDVLPDAPIQAGYVEGGSLLPAGIEPREGRPRGSQEGLVDERQGGGVAGGANTALAQGVGLRNQRRGVVETARRSHGEASSMPAVFTLENFSTTDIPIASSLHAPFRHTYAAVLAPPPPPPEPSTGGNGTSDGGGQGAGQKAGAGGKPKNPFSDATALILQLKAPDIASEDSLAEKCGQYIASSRASDQAVVDRKRGAGGGQCGIPPRVCGWRACLADASSGSLCTAHLELKDFLDGKAAKNGGVSDAFRFLPPGSGPKRRSSLRKRRAAAAAAAAAAATPMDANSSTTQHSTIAATLSAEGVGARNGEGELSVMRSMSPLLSELLNGKLGKTIAMFCRRAAEESRVSRRRGPKQHAPPEWARWADPEGVKAADLRLDADARWAEKVLRAEKEVTLELRRLSNLEIYPVSELAHIRREHEAMAKEWHQAVGGGDVEDGDGQYGEEEDDDEGDRSKNTPAARASAQPLLMMLPPSGTKRRRKEPLIPSLAEYGATTNPNQSSAASTKPGAASARGEQPQLLLSSTASGAGANGGHGGSAAEKGLGGRRQRRKGSLGAGVAGNRGSAKVRTGERGVRGGSDVGGRQALPGSQGKSEQEIELEFSRLKWALFRRRRQEAEVPKAFARSHAPGHGQALVPPLGETPPISSPAGGRAGRHRETREVGEGGGGSPADTPIKLPKFSPATPTEQQLYQLARATEKNGGGGGGGGRRGQHQHQHEYEQLADIMKMQPIQAVHNDRRELPLQPSESQGPRPSSSTMSGTDFPHQAQELLTVVSPTGDGDQHRVSHQQPKQPQQQSRHTTARFPLKAVGTPTAAISPAVSNPRQRYTPPPKWESRGANTQAFAPCSADEDATAISADVTAGEGPAQAILRLPRGTAERVMRVSSDGSDRDKKTEEHGKGGSARVLLRRRASVAGAARAHHNPSVSRGLLGKELRGFDAAPYQTTVHFRDR